MQYGTDSTRVTVPPVSLGFFVVWLILISALAGTVHVNDLDASLFSSMVLGITENKVLWLCLGIAIWHLIQDRITPISRYALIAALPAITLSLLSPGLIAWLGLAASLLLIHRCFRFTRSRTGMWLAIAASSQLLVTEFLSQLGGDTILGAEAQFVGSVAGLFLNDIQVEGTALTGSQGHTLIMVWGCSSLSNLGHSLLLFWSLVSLRTPKLINSSQRWSMIACTGFICVLVVAVNLVRIGLMVIGPDMYQYMHHGDGAGLARITTLAMVAILALSVFPHDKTS